jgi:hypothetical protein
MKNASPKKLIGALIKVVIGAIVLTYLGLHTINFFNYTFPPDQQYLSWLGFGLTGGGLIGYLVIFLWDADTQLKKVVALLMTIICGIGEVLAAGFGMTIEAWTRQGWTMTQQDFDTMLLAIRALAFAHFVALIVYMAGDKITSLFGDDDGDGIINLLDPVDNRKTSKQPPVVVNQNAADTDAVVNEVIARIRANGHKIEDPTNQPRR